MTTDTRKPRAFAPDDPALGDAVEAGAPTQGQREAPLAARRTRQSAARASVRPTIADLSRGLRWGGMLLSGLVRAPRSFDHLVVHALRGGLARAPGLGRLARLCHAVSRGSVGPRPRAARDRRPVPFGSPRQAAPAGRPSPEGRRSERRAPRHPPPQVHPFAARRPRLAAGALCRARDGGFESARSSGPRRPRADDAARSGGAPHRARGVKARRHGGRDQPAGMGLHGVRAV